MVTNLRCFLFVVLLQSSLYEESVGDIGDDELPPQVNFSASHVHTIKHRAINRHQHRHRRRCHTLSASSGRSLHVNSAVTSVDNHRLKQPSTDSTTTAPDLHNISFSFSSFPPPHHRSPRPTASAPSTNASYPANRMHVKTTNLSLPSSATSTHQCQHNGKADCITGPHDDILEEDDDTDATVLLRCARYLCIIFSSFLYSLFI